MECVIFCDAPCNLGDSKFRPTVKNLEVTFDKDFKFDEHIASVVKVSVFPVASFNQGQAYLLIYFYNPELERVVHTFISSRLVHCSALCGGNRRLQRVQNTAAHF